MMFTEQFNSCMCILAKNSLTGGGGLVLKLDTSYQILLVYLQQSATGETNCKLRHSNLRSPVGYFYLLFDPNGQLKKMI